MTRRDLIQKVILGTTSLIIIPEAFTSCSKDNTDPGGGNGNGNGGGTNIILDLTAAANAALNTSGGTVISKGVIIANTGNNVFVAIDSVCTHMGCTIGYSLAANNFPCPCHGSVYSTTGAVLNGPATIGLKSYPVSKSGNVLTVSLT